MLPTVGNSSSPAITTLMQYVLSTLSTSARCCHSFLRGAIVTLSRHVKVVVACGGGDRVFVPWLVCFLRSGGSASRASSTSRHKTNLEGRSTWSWPFSGAFDDWHPPSHDPLQASKWCRQGKFTACPKLTFNFFLVRQCLFFFFELRAVLGRD